MGAHKGIKWENKPAKIRYFAKNQRRVNKLRRIAKCNGPVFLAQWKASYPS